MAGPFYNALVDADSDGLPPPFGPEHLVEDMRIYTFRCSHPEGQKPSIEFDVRNPGMGLLAPSRGRWIIFSWDSGDTEPAPLFVGRIVGVSGNMLGNVVTVRAVADPPDYAAQKQAVARSLKEPPYYDPIGLDETKRDDADAILEGYAAAWHVDRVTLEVTVSDYITPEDGILTYGPDDRTAYYDSLDFELNEAPLPAVKVDMEVNWTQGAAGTVDIGKKTFPFASADGSLSGWPETGANLSGGWSVEHAVGAKAVAAAAVQNVQSESHYKNITKYRELFDDELISVDQTYNGPPFSRVGQGILISRDETIRRSDRTKGTGESIQISESRLIVQTFEPKTELVLRYDAARPRHEHVSFTLVADVQPVLGSEGVVAESLSITGADVGVPLIAYDGLTGELIADSDSEENVPIGDLSRRSFFPTDRGLQFLQYGIARARAKLIPRARAASVSWEVPFRESVQFSCRMGARIIEDRLSGGEALGKVVSYGFSGDGDSGVFIGVVTIAPAVGYGNAIETSDGTNDYIDDDYIEPGYYHASGTMIAIGAGDVAYSIPLDAANDDGLVFPLTRGQVVVSEVTTPGFVDPNDDIGGIISAASLGSRLSLVRGITGGGFSVPGSGVNEIHLRNDIASKQVQQYLKAAGGTYELTLKPLTGSYDVEYVIDLSNLVLPKQIDLEAA